MSDNKELTEPMLALRKCFICNGWAEPKHIVEVSLNNLVTEVCRLCYRDLKDRQASLDREELKEVEDEEAASAFDFEQL